MNERVLAALRRARAAPARRPRDVVVPGPGQRSVWDFPRPPRVEAVAARVRVVFGGVTIAESDRALRVVETAGAPCYYLPPDDVLADALVLTERTSLCEWKGFARYFDVRAGDAFAAGAAWAYLDPLDDLGCGYGAIAGFRAFYCAAMDACYVGAERVRPQPGGFYGGWVTDDLTGPIKGEPGSERW